MNNVRYLILHLVVAISLLLFAGKSAFASRGESVWKSFQKASDLERQNGSSKDIASLYERVRRQATDPLLRARASLKLSEYLIEEGNIGKAQAVLRELYQDQNQLESVRNEARLHAGLLFFLKKNRHEALRLLTAVAQAASGTFLRDEARLGLAQIYTGEENWLRADSLMNALITSSPTYKRDERLLVLEARAAIAREEPEAAVKILAASETKLSLKHLAKAYELSGRPLLAIATYQKIAERFADTREAERALWLAGDLFMRMEDWLAARSQFRQLLETFPEGAYNLAVAFRLGWIALELGNFDEVRELFVTSPSSDLAPYFSYMQAEAIRKHGLNESGENQEAIVMYNDLAALHPDAFAAPYAKLRAATAHLQQGRSDDAVINLRQFLSLYPKHTLAAEANFVLGTLEKEPKRTKHFNEVLQKHKGTVLFDATLVALQQGDFSRGRYQAVVDRAAHFQGIEAEALGQRTTRTSNEWQRLHHLIVAESAYFLKQYDLAEAEFSAVFSESDDYWSQRAQLGQAWCLLQNEDLASAESSFRLLEKRFLGENRIRASFGLATAYFRQGKFREAAQAYPTNTDDSDELRSLLAKAFLRVGECYGKMQDYGLAIETWQGLVTDFPESELAPLAQYRIADVYFQANHFDEAIVGFQAVLEDHPEHSLAATSVLRIAQSKFNSGQYEGAVQDFQTFLQRYPNHTASADAVEGVQLGYYQLGQSGQALDALEKLVANSQNVALSADARFRIARHYLETEDYERAVAAFKEILARFPSSSFASDAQFALALAYHQTEDYESANQEFERFLEYFPESAKRPEVFFRLGVGYFNLRRFATARDYFEQVVRRPQSTFRAPALQNLAWCFHELGGRAEAAQRLDTYLSEYPGVEDSEKVRMQLAIIESELGKTTEAAARLRKLLGSTNLEIATEAGYRLGVLWLEVENWDAAREAFDFSIKLNVAGNAFRLSSMSRLASMYEAESNWQKAVETYRLLADSTTEEKWRTAAESRIEVLEEMMAGPAANIAN